MKETIKIKNNMDNQALKKLVIEKISDVARLNTTSFAPLYLDIVAVSLIAVIILLVVNWFDIGTQRIIGISVIICIGVIICISLVLYYICYRKYKSDTEQWKKSTIYAIENAGNIAELYCVLLKLQDDVFAIEPKIVARDLKDIICPFISTYDRYTTFSRHHILSVSYDLTTSFPKFIDLEDKETGEVQREDIGTYTTVKESTKINHTTFVFENTGLVILQPYKPKS